MRYWLDTEFIEDGKTIDLISIGIVAEDGREYYAVNKECAWSKASDWVLENVLTPMGLSRHGWILPLGDLSPRQREEYLSQKTKAEITDSIAAFLGCEKHGDVEILIERPSIGTTLKSLLKLRLPPVQQHKYWNYKFSGSKSEQPEIWAYYADYDWVAFCQLFGTMMDLPEGFPMYCRDIKQMCDELGNPELPKQGEGEHNALEDARWNKKAWQFLVNSHVAPI